MIDIPQFIKRASENCGFKRETFDESKIPTSVSNLTIMPFFGDIKSTFVLSSLLLKQYREKLKGSKYFILCSWPGHVSLFPHVDEFWSLSDVSNINDFYNSALGFKNTSELSTVYHRKLNQFFDDVIDPAYMETFYKNGISSEFAKKFGEVLVYYPMVPSITMLGNDFSRALLGKAGYRVVVHPSIYVDSWRMGQLQKIKVPKDFWIALIESLINEGFTPIVANLHGTHDVSNKFADQCLYTGKDLSKAMCTMRAADCVVDVFSDISKLAVLARSPYVSCIERMKFIKAKDYEIDDLCSKRIPKQYIFTFSTILESGNLKSWKVNIFDSLITKLNKFLPTLDKNSLPAGTEDLTEVSYDNVRKQRVKKFGTRFIKVQQD